MVEGIFIFLDILVGGCFTFCFFIGDFVLYIGECGVVVENVVVEMENISCAMGAFIVGGCEWQKYKTAFVKCWY